MGNGGAFLFFLMFGTLFIGCILASPFGLICVVLYLRQSERLSKTDYRAVGKAIPLISIGMLAIAYYYKVDG